MDYKKVIVVSLGIIELLYIAFDLSGINYMEFGLALLFSILMSSLIVLVQYKILNNNNEEYNKE